MSEHTTDTDTDTTDATPAGGDVAEPTLAEQIEQNRETAAKAEAEAERPADVPLADLTNRPLVDLGRHDLEQFPSSVGVEDVPVSLPVDSPSLATMTDKITAEHAVRAAADTITDPATGALTVENAETDILADPAAHPDYLATRGKAVTEGPPARSDQPAVATDDAEDEGSVTFISERHPSLIAFSGEGSLIGQFVDGRFTTNRAADIEALDKLDGVVRA